MKKNYYNDAYFMKRDSLSLHVAESITMFMKKFLKETHRVLRSSGFVFFIAPNFGSPLRHIQGKNWFGYEDSTHIRFDTTQTINDLLHIHGFHKIQFQFRSSSRDSAEIEALPYLVRLPKFIKNYLNYLLFTTPFTHLRNGFWVAAQK